MIPALDEDILICYGARGLFRWTPEGVDYYPYPERHIEPNLVCDELVLLRKAIEQGRSHISVHSFWTTFLLRRISQEKFSAACKNSTILLEAVFRLKLGEIDFIDLSERAADSEVAGRDWCLLLQECRLDAEAYVSKMLNLNNGGDVYLKPLDCREREEWQSAELGEATGVLHHPCDGSGLSSQRKIHTQYLRFSLLSVDSSKVKTVVKDCIMSTSGNGHLWTTIDRIQM